MSSGSDDDDAGAPVPSALEQERGLVDSAIGEHITRLGTLLGAADGALSAAVEVGDRKRPDPLREKLRATLGKRMVESHRLVCHQFALVAAASSAIKTDPSLVLHGSSMVLQAVLGRRLKQIAADPDLKSAEAIAAPPWALDPARWREGVVMLHALMRWKASRTQFVLTYWRRFWFLKGTATRDRYSVRILLLEWARIALRRRTATNRCWTLNRIMKRNAVTRILNAWRMEDMSGRRHQRACVTVRLRAGSAAVRCAFAAWGVETRDARAEREGAFWADKVEAISDELAKGEAEATLHPKS